MLSRLTPDDTRLRKTLNDIPLTLLRTTGVQQQIEELLEFVYKKNNKGEKTIRTKPNIIGLSANQVGIMKRICIVDFAVRKIKYADIHVLVNPKITWYSKTTSVKREGCVNLQNIWGYVPRSTEIAVTFLDRWGNMYQMRAKGWVAILIQHEVDHLNGKLFIDRLKVPTKAQYVEEKDFLEYKKDPKEWRRYIDVTKWVRDI